MTTLTRPPIRPCFMRGIRYKTVNPIHSHDPYQALAAIYLLRFVLSLKNQFTLRQLRPLFEDQLGLLTGLTEMAWDSQDEELFDYDEEEDTFAEKLNSVDKTQCLREIRNRLKALMTQDMVVDAPLFNNMNRLAEKLGLNETEQELLVLRILMEVFPEMSRFLAEHCQDCTGSVLRQYLQMMTTRSVREIQSALDGNGRLNQLAWLCVAHETVDLEDKLKLATGLLDIILTAHDSTQDMFNQFYQSCPTSLLGLEDYAHLNAQLEVVIPYLNAALQSQKPGVNVLIYGPLGTGKTELTKLLAGQLQIELFEVRHTNEKGDAINGKARFTAYRVAQQLLSKHTQPCLILFDEAEDVFPDPNAFDWMTLFNDARGGASGDKAWINNQLETNPVPTLWIVNQTRGLDQAYLRRFDYSILIDKMPLAVRQKLVEKYTHKLNIDASWRDYLAQHEQITPAQIARAAKMVVLTQSYSPINDQEQMTRILNASNLLLNKPLLRKSAQHTTAYHLNFTNTSSPIPLTAIIRGLTHSPKASLCFYGPSGTGKTALGRHIAEQTSLPLCVKKASDVLERYVGDSEKNIAAMFQEAQNQGAILLLDEADSLLGDRHDAHHSWEISQVNEMLTQMERFEGIFICTTNLMERLDTASLRRFDFKIQFHYLTVSQRWDLFIQELKRLDGCLPDNQQEVDRLQQQMKRLTQLTPGDFSVVSRRQTILGDTMTPQRMIEELSEECKAKGEKLNSIGFV
jgi:transitional endoplasmic reticulum ATPase